MSNSSSSTGPALPLTPAEDRQWASFAHFGGVLLFLPSLIIYLVFKDRGDLTRQEAKEALNFQITYAIAAVVLSIVISLLGTVLYFAGAGAAAALLGNLPYLLYITNVIFSIVAGVRVHGGGSYRYPFALRLIR